MNTQVEVHAIRPEHAEPLPVRRVTLSGKLKSVSGDYLFRGHLEGAFHHRCDRCLEDDRFVFDRELAWYFRSATPLAPEEDDGPPQERYPWCDGDAGLRTYRQGEIDLGPSVWEELLFALPEKFLCKEDCKGLCPRCGANLNAAPCECMHEADETGESKTIKGLSGLKALLSRLPEESSEEE